MTYNTVQEINEALDVLYKEYKAKVKPLEDLVDEVYEAQMASCSTLEEQWELYKICPSKFLKHAYSFSSNIRDFRIQDYIVHYDVFDNEIREPFEYWLHHWIYYEDEYISHEAILQFFEYEPIEIEVRSNIIKKYINVKVPEHILNTWKEILIKNKIGNLYVSEYY